jgi:dihydroorotate dehydrogenase
MIYKIFLRPILFFFNPENAHHITFALIKFFCRFSVFRFLMKKLFVVRDEKLKRKIFGIEFPNPVGLAAGLDKNALLIDEWENVGFGFVEIGTVTPLPQSGNDKPRLFRLPHDKAIINRMGFNNDGMQVIAERLKNKKSKIIVGGNIGKNKITPNENAVDDYEKSFHALYEFVDYFVINVSSPNTPGLRDLQEKEPLKKIILHLQKINSITKKPKPILLKIAPDLNELQLQDIVEITDSTGLDGLIATNTTLSRENLLSEKSKIISKESGGLSGTPLKNRSTEIIKFLRKNLKKNIPIIASGGVMNANDAFEKINAGADLVQVYTGFIYEGPQIVKEINLLLKNQK